FRPVALLGFPFRGLFLSRSPDGSSPPACPLDVCSRRLAFLRPRRRILRARRALPRMLGAGVYFRLQGFGPRGSRSSSVFGIPSNRSIFPSWVSPPHGVHPPERGVGCPAPAACASPSRGLSIADR